MNNAATHKRTFLFGLHGIRNPQAPFFVYRDVMVLCKGRGVADKVFGGVKETVLQKILSDFFKIGRNYVVLDPSLVGI